MRTSKSPGNLSHLDDQELARRAQAGSIPCFEELVRRYQVPLLRFLLRKIRDPFLAEDLLQDSFLRAFQSLHQYRDRWLFRTWIFTLTYRLAVSHGRKKQIPADNNDLCNISTNAASPLDDLENKESRQQLWQTASQILSDDQFNALWLHYAEAMPAGEVAHVLGRSWMWVKTNLHRARRKLLVQLQSAGES